MQLNDCLFIKFGKDTTKRISFRKDDLLFHLRFTNIFNKTVSILDVWQLKSGDYATITNRLDDLPSGFKLHPTEACGPLVYKIIEQYNGSDGPSEPIYSNNLWRVRDGDMLIWLGSDRPDNKSDNGILQIYLFSECALLSGESNYKTLENSIDFGAITNIPNYDKRINEVRELLKSLKLKGLPNSISTAWRLG
jgi:hypothetical protein